VDKEKEEGEDIKKTVKTFKKYCFKEGD